MNQKEKNLVNEAAKHALEILHQCVTPYGFRASADPVGYPQVWSRDSSVTLLGALASEDKELINAGRASLDALSGAQSCWGMIPLNLNPESGDISTENAGSCDANLWYIRFTAPPVIKTRWRAAGRESPARSPGCSTRI